MAETTRPSIIVILLDALRADCAPFMPETPHLRSLGLMRPELGALTDLVRGAFLFTQAMACSAYTTACVGSIFTGLLPPEHGVRAFDLTSLSNDVRTLAEILAESGYATCAMTDQPAVLQPMGLLRGFQRIAPTEDEALAWWDSYDSMPRFLFLHLWDLHKPYGMPVGRAYRRQYPAIVAQWQERLRSRGIAEPTASQFLDENEERQRVYAMQNAWEDACGFKAGLENYIAGLVAFDEGRLRDLAGALAERRGVAESITMVLADHGEGRDFRPSWRMAHSMSLADDVIHIPLYLRLPGQAPALPISQQVSQADVAPTLLDCAGFLAQRTAPRSPCAGRSLLPRLRGEHLPEQPAYAEVSTLNNDPNKPVGQAAGGREATLRFRLLRHARRKYHLAGQLFSLDDIPAGAAPAEVIRLLCRDLLGRIERQEDVATWLPILQDSSVPDQARRRMLLALIERSDEYRFLVKYAIYDLEHDPLEVKPIDPRRRASDWEAYRKQVQIMLDIDQQARPGEPLLTNEADEEIILKRLRNLGYVE